MNLGSIILCIILMLGTTERIFARDTTKVTLNRIFQIIKNNKSDSLRKEILDLKTVIQTESEIKNELLNSQMNSLKDSISKIRSVAALPKIEEKRNDVVAVLATVLQAIGFLILLCSWYFQNHRQAEWEAKKDIQRWMWHQTMHHDTTLDILQTRLNDLGLDANTQRSQNPNFIEVYREYLEDFFVNILQYLKGVRKMYAATPIANTPEATITIDDLISKMQTTWDKYSIPPKAQRNGSILENIVFNYRDAQRIATARMGKFINEYRETIAETIRKENILANRWYLIGSIYILASFIIQIKRDLPETPWWLFFLSVSIVCGFVFLIINKLGVKLIIRTNSPDKR